MRRGLLFVAVPLMVLALPALAQQPQQREPIDPTPPPRGTASFEPPPATVENAPLTAQTFVIRAAIVNMMETDLAELALSRSQNAAIQSFARRMLDEHRRAQEKLRLVAADTNIALPAMVDVKHQELKDSLKRSSGTEFDNGYVKAMVSGHDDAVALFDAATSSATLPKPLQRHAMEMLPIIRNHRDAAHKLQLN
jgi:putative membrane protein